MTGKVYLVGAGIGDAAYLTQQARNCLAQADVLIYDALIEPSLLAIAPPFCVKILAGKRGGAKSTPQAEINRLLVYYAQQGQQVVRLKSGDPLVFGRSREEVEALREHNCAFEIVPGLSSAIAVPLLAGIPLTDKFLSQGFAVVTAHQPEMLDWSALARLDTLVILMGGRSLETITAELQQQGKSPETPVALIRNGGRTDEQIWTGNLANIAAQTDPETRSPCIIVIGAVVGLRALFQPMNEDLPLTGRTVLITRSASQSPTFRRLLTSQGANILEMPALEIQPPSSWQLLDDAIARLSQFDWLILTSSNGVQYFCDRLSALNKDLRALQDIKIALVGKKTAATLGKYHLKPDFIPPSFVADSLVAAFPESLLEKQILFPRVETGGRELLVQEFTEKGAIVTEVPAYQSVCPSTINPEALAAFKNRTIDVVTFASSKTVRNFYDLLAAAVDDVSAILSDVAIASIGPQTSATCLELFQRVDIEATEYTLEGLTQAIVNNYQ
ncbi:MAG: uroporphyrinogen-III C-methyltransferase [Jaaginema sp. PMC 1079.18]|nr:uroporphyrinogen-III C-methyltransferase [Jaaginema sp. PMC 1080.18]MEC4854034.1 uroporphyrinogen-III C-methyltransferase [Jaaginema sp. PMC 1079.18]MEC4864846.1 uroporphyrinogen-III C-methyltransferase [Jaaginema sp. PMC 1078.18]